MYVCGSHFTDLIIRQPMVVDLIQDDHAIWRSGFLPSDVHEIGFFGEDLMSHATQNVVCFNYDKTANRSSTFKTSYNVGVPHMTLRPGPA